jgi:MarR family transcriptional regulator, 2-MHQ and catechol-resistance regulon repressor
VTSLVTTLERRKLVKRRTSKIDRRLVIVELTPQGKALIEWVFPKFNQGEIEVASTLSEAEQETLAHLLRKVVSGVNTQISDFAEEEAAPI